MGIKGIEKALNEGCTLHGFSSGGGLRVIRIEKNGDLKGYGEYPNVEKALSHAGKDYLAGGREYSEVYGQIYPHYLTGTRKITNSLDGWLLQGSTIDAHKEEGEVIIELNGWDNNLNKISKRGKGKEFFDALNNALKAESINKN